MLQLVTFEVSGENLPPELREFDAPIRDLVEEVYPTTERDELLCHIPGICFLANAVSNAITPVGIANLRFEAPEEFGMDTAWIDTLVVAEQKRHCGLHIGSQLLERAVSLAKHEGLEAIGIEATETTLDFWRHNEFSSVSPQPPARGIFTEVMCRIL